MFPPNKWKPYDEFVTLIERHREGIAAYCQPEIDPRSAKGQCFDDFLLETERLLSQLRSV